MKHITRWTMATESPCKLKGNSDVSLISFLITFTPDKLDRFKSYNLALSSLSLKALYIITFPKSYPINLGNVTIE